MIIACVYGAHTNARICIKNLHGLYHSIFILTRKSTILSPFYREEMRFREARQLSQHLTVSKEQSRDSSAPRASALTTLV